MMLTQLDDDTTSVEADGSCLFCYVSLELKLARTDGSQTPIVEVVEREGYHRRLRYQLDGERWQLLNPDEPGRADAPSQERRQAMIQQLVASAAPGMCWAVDHTPGESHPFILVLKGEAGRMARPSISNGS